MSTYFDVNLDLSREDRMIRDEAHKFARDIMRPISREIDKVSAEEATSEGSPVWRFLSQAYRLGYHKAAFPEEVGGLGCTPLQSHLIAEELSWGSVGLNAILGMASWIFGKVLATGDAALIQTFVMPFFQCRDGSILGCWAITEPAHGSDHLAIGETFFKDSKIEGQVSARLEGDAYVLNGQKAAWVSCAPIATHCMLNVHIDKSMGLSGGGVCILPLDLPGISRGKPLEKVGQRELPQGELFFDEVKIPKDWMFHGTDTYTESVLGNLGLGNTGMSIVALSLARAAFEEAFTYARERVQGGKPLIEHYSMKARIHRLFSKVEAIRAMSRAIHNLNSRVDPPVYEYAYAAKTFCTDTAREVVEEAVQIHGANGLTKEYLIEKLWRDSRALTIEDGDNRSLNRLGGHILKETFPRRTVNQFV
ncbi:MAG: acyl-CoA dehydrogenase family protein [Desulfobacterales bacterium]